MAITIVTHNNKRRKERVPVVEPRLPLVRRAADRQKLQVSGKTHAQPSETTGNEMSNTSDTITRISIPFVSKAALRAAETQIHGQLC